MLCSEQCFLYHREVHGSPSSSSCFLASSRVLLIKKVDSKHSDVNRANTSHAEGKHPLHDELLSTDSTY